MKKTQSAIFLQEMLREPCVAGSNPAPLTNEWVAQLVEQRIKASCFFCRVLAVVASVAHNHEVGSSNLSSAPNLELKFLLKRCYPSTLTRRKLFYFE